MTTVVLSTLLSFAALAFASDTGPADLCASRKAGASAAAFLVMPASRPRDTLVVAAVCVIPARTSAAAVGSYHGELYFDSTAVRVLRVEKAPGGMRVENTLPGQVNFAGASPDGFPPGALISVKLRVRKRGAKPGLRLKMLELNATNGQNLMTHLVISATPQP